jgi:hypothetical protein
MGKKFKVSWFAGYEYQFVMRSEINDFIPASFPRHMNYSFQQVIKHFLMYESQFDESDSFEINGKTIIGFRNLIEYVKRILLKIYNKEFESF